MNAIERLIALLVLKNESGIRDLFRKNSFQLTDPAEALKPMAELWRRGVNESSPAAAQANIQLLNLYTSLQEAIAALNVYTEPVWKDQTYPGLVSLQEASSLANQYRLWLEVLAQEDRPEWDSAARLPEHPLS